MLEPAVERFFDNRGQLRLSLHCNLVKAVDWAGHKVVVFSHMSLRVKRFDTDRRRSTE